MEESRCRKDQVPTLSTDAVPSIGEPDTVERQGRLALPGYEETTQPYNAIDQAGIKAGKGTDQAEKA